jgi:hypothetical protein
MKAVEGMTLRDYFAAKAMMVYLFKRKNTDDAPEDVEGWLGDMSYQIADIMLKAREE